MRSECTQLVKRATAGGEQLVLKTGGQVSCLLESDGGGKKSETQSVSIRYMYMYSTGRVELIRE
jgi:hypothetical protein